ncbi:MAG: PQQ-binding-like beta-propeller repeat protein [Planctomycetota bacterium]
MELAGYGQSTPVTDGKTIYITSVSGDNKEQLHVQALSVDRGEELWRRDFANVSPEPNNSYVSRAAPSPAADRDGVVAFFEGGNVVALDAAGEVRWELNLVEQYGALAARHGLAASLEQDESRVFVWVERQENPFVLALNKKSGAVEWKSDGVGATSWSSPRLISVGESNHLVLSAIGSLVGLDAETGERLWTLEGVTGNSAPTPVPMGIGRFLIGATTGRGTSAGGGAAASNGVVEIVQSEAGDWSAAYAWRAKRATSSFGSPIAHRGCVYFINRSGVVYCLDAATGEEHYAKRIGSSSWATPIGAGEHVYFFGKDGSATVLKAGAKFEAVGESTTWETGTASTEGAPGPRLGNPVLYAASIINGKLLLRRGDRLYCVKP